MDAVSPPARPVHAADRILQAIERNPVAAFAVFVLVHVLLWTVLPALLQRDLQLDAIEGVAYGRDWQLGYWKHPPLPWLLMDITHRIFGARLWPFFLLGQLAAPWRSGRRGDRARNCSRRSAPFAVVILDGSIGFNTTVPTTISWNCRSLRSPAGRCIGRSSAALRDWLLVGLVRWRSTQVSGVRLLLPVLASRSSIRTRGNAGASPDRMSRRWSAPCCARRNSCGWRSSTTSARSNSPKARPSPPCPCLIFCGRP
jgi:hypothetical protein